MHYSFPARINSDQGQTFESKLIEELCDIAGAEKSRTTPYQPMGNGQCERFNQTLLKMLGTLEDYQKRDWKAHVPTLMHAYNATFHDSTGHSSYFLMYGRHPRRDVDAFLGLSPDALCTSSRQNTGDSRYVDFAYLDTIIYVEVIFHSQHFFSIYLCIATPSMSKTVNMKQRVSRGDFSCPRRIFYYICYVLCRSQKSALTRAPYCLFRLLPEVRKSSKQKSKTK